MTVLCIWERSLKQQQQKTKTLPHTFGKALGFYPKLFPPDLVYEGSLVWEEKQGIFGEKMVQEGWHQNPNPGNYKYWRKKYFHYAWEWGWGEAG